MIHELLSKKCYFITGIDTDAGKTCVTGYLSRTLLEEGVNVITQKLIQTGNTGISEDIELHRRIEGRPLQEVDLDGTTCPLIYSYPCSPHMALTIDERAPQYELATASTRALLAKYDQVLIEGAGGLMVPLTEELLTIDYIQQQELPVILVTTAKLGSINHTLLNLEVLRKRDIPVDLVVYNAGIHTDDRITAETEAYLRRHIKAPMIVCPTLEIH